MPVLFLAAAGVFGYWLAFGSRDWPAPDFAGDIMAMFPDRAATRAALRSASQARGLDPRWLDAIAWVESRWRQDARNVSGADARRGGAWGACQLTLQTAIALGFDSQWTPGEGMSERAYADGYRLVADLDYYAGLCALNVSQGRPDSFESAVAWWNAGRRRIDDPSIPASTVNDYLPKARAALAMVDALDRSVA